MNLVGYEERFTNVWFPVETTEVPEKSLKVRKTATDRALPYPADRAHIDGILIGAAEHGGLDLETILDSPAGRSLLEARSVAPPGAPLADVGKAEPVSWPGEMIADVIVSKVAEKGETFLASAEGRRLVASFEDAR